MLDFRFVDPSVSTPRGLIDTINFNVTLLKQYVNQAVNTTKLTEDFIITSQNVTEVDPFVISSKFITKDSEMLNLAGPLTQGKISNEGQIDTNNNLFVNCSINASLLQNKDVTVYLADNSYSATIYCVGSDETYSISNGDYKTFEVLNGTTSIYCNIYKTNNVSILVDTLPIGLFSLVEGTSLWDAIVSLSGVPSLYGNYIDTNGNRFESDFISEDGTLTRKIAKRYLDGTTLAAYDQRLKNNNKYFTIHLGDFDPKQNIGKSLDLLCSHFVPSISADKGTIYLDIDSNDLYVFPITNFNSVAEFNNWLSLNELEVCIYYPTSTISSSSLGQSFPEKIYGFSYIGASPTINLTAGRYMVGTNTLEVYIDGKRSRPFIDYYEVSASAINLINPQFGSKIHLIYPQLSLEVPNIEASIENLLARCNNLISEMSLLKSNFISVKDDADDLNTRNRILYNSVVSISAELISFREALFQQVVDINELYTGVNSQLTTWESTLAQTRSLIQSLESVLDQYETSSSFYMKIFNFSIDKSMWSTSYPYIANVYVPDLPAVIKHGLLLPGENSYYEDVAKIKEIDVSYNMLTVESTEILSTLSLSLVCFI